MIQVPKVFHRIWLGSPIPDEFRRYGETWLEHHPGWQLKLWTEKNLTTIYPDLVKKCERYRHRSNIYRYELLYKEGGIYIDTDFVCQKSIEPLIDSSGFFTAIQTDSEDHPNAYANGFFGCTPIHPIMRLLVESVPGAFCPQDELNCGPALFTRCVKEIGGARILPRDYFYPFLWNELHRSKESFPNAYAVHHWSSKWLKNERTEEYWKSSP